MTYPGGRYATKPIEGKLPLPSKELMKYGIDHDILDSPGLMMHVALGRTVAFAMGKKMIDAGEKIDMDTTLALTGFHHTTRQRADYGREGKSSRKVNNMMVKYDDIDYAVKEALAHKGGKGKKKFDDKVIQGIKDIRRNPATREAYFPHETLEKNGVINRSQTIPMLTSWLVTGPIVTIEDRFKDLKNRRNDEIGRPELLYIKNNPSKKIPKQIVESAIKDKVCQNEEDLRKLIHNDKITPDQMGKLILNGYEERCKKAVDQFCKKCGINNFHDWLKSELQPVKEKEKIDKANEEFKKYFGRDLDDTKEFIPYIPGIERIYNMIGNIKQETSKVNELKKKLKIDLIENLGEKKERTVWQHIVKKCKKSLLMTLLNVKNQVIHPILSSKLRKHKRSLKNHQGVLKEKMLNIENTKKEKR